jgi:DtxR family Mn-dependent transcriptional regulator
MPSLTVENYLKAILQIELQTGRSCVSGGQLAIALGVSPGTVTSMQKNLAEARLADYRPYEGVSLTESGRRVALRMLRRHRLIELFLVQTLNLTWDQVHSEAENMEHAVSDFLIDRIDEFLGHPEHDPHGDPIPAANGELRGAAGSTLRLVSCEPHMQVRVTRVTHQDAEFLRYLSDTGIELGAAVVVIANQSAAGTIEVEIGTRRTTLGHQAAEHILVEPLSVEAT